MAKQKAKPFVPSPAAPVMTPAQEEEAKASKLDAEFIVEYNKLVVKYNRTLVAQLGVKRGANQ